MFEPIMIDGRWYLTDLYGKPDLDMPCRDEAHARRAGAYALREYRRLRASLPPRRESSCRSRPATTPHLTDRQLCRHGGD